MIVPITSLIFYMVDPILGVVMAIVLPYAISLDNSLSGEYGNTVVAIIFGVVAYFIRKVGFDQEGT